MLQVKDYTICIRFYCYNAVQYHSIVTQLKEIINTLAPDADMVVFPNAVSMHGMWIINILHTYCFV